MDELKAYKRELRVQTLAREAAEKELEEKSRELYERNLKLEQALKQLSDQQHQLVAQEKMASVGQLAAGLAHEINNPNAFIISNLSTLNDYVASIQAAFSQLQQQLVGSSLQAPGADIFQRVTNENDVEFILDDLDCLLKETQQGAQRIKRIIDGLRYFTNQDPKQVIEFDLVQCIENTVRLLTQESGCQIEVELQLSNLPIYKGVPPLISQAFSNILKNAVEAKPKSALINVHAKEVSDSVLIGIRDDGEGIAAGNLNKIFDPFFTTKPYVNGLGLTISQAIIRQHDGQITVSSELGHYTEVVIVLPV